MKRQHWVCCYDIRDIKRLAKVHQLLAMQGIALNYSVFYLLVTEQQLAKLQEKMIKLVNIQDDVRFYACTAWQDAQMLGQALQDEVSLV